MHPRGKLVRRQPRDMLRVHPVEFFAIEHGVADADPFERERRHELVTREDLLIVAWRPSEQRQKIHHRLRQITLARVLHDGRRAVSLTQAFLVAAENQRHVRELRQRRVERAIQEDLLRCVRDVIVAAHHVRDCHVDVVGNHRQVISGMTIGPQDHEVFDVRAVEFDPAVNEIVERHRAFGHTDADRPRHARGFAPFDLRGRQCTAGSIVPPRAASALGRLALCVQLLGAAIAVVRAAGCDELLRDLAVATEPL